MVAPLDTNDLTNIKSLISLNKKFNLEIGLKNPVLNSQYDDILWFPQGMYVITTSNISESTSGCTIQITAKDKMCMLDGTIGGIFPA
jgi:hypothetical protein